MNMANGHLEGSGSDVYAVFGPHRLKVDRRALDRHPGIENYMNKDIVMGIRPGDFEDARVVEGGEDRSMEIDVEVTEVLGSETFVHYTLAIPPVITPEIEELMADAGTGVETLGDTSRFSSRISSDVAVQPGSRAKFVVDTAKMHFFDRETGGRVGYVAGAYTTA